jgi:hypothetical protein
MSLDAQAPNSLIRNLIARQRHVELVFADSIEKFMRSFRCASAILNETNYSYLSIRLIKHNATSGNSTSYMLSYMHPVYKAGQRDSGMRPLSPRFLVQADC